MSDISNHYIGHEYDPSTPPDGGCLGVLIAAVVGFIICVIITLFTGCARTQYITKETPVYVHDTLTTIRVHHDSIYNRDSVYIERYIVGDTVFVNKIAERWRTKVDVRHDTVINTMETPVELVKEVPVYIDKPSPWKRLRSLLSVMLAVVGIIISTLIMLRFGIFSKIADQLKRLIK